MHSGVAEGALTRGGRIAPASPSAWRRALGENGARKWVFYIPVVFMVSFLAVPMTPSSTVTCP